MSSQHQIYKKIRGKVDGEITMKKLTTQDELTEFLLYTTPNSDIKVETYLHDETVWLPQKRMAELFGVDVSTINEHLKNIYKSHELEEKATIGKFPIVQIEGKREVRREIKKILNHSTKG